MNTTQQPLTITKRAEDLVVGDVITAVVGTPVDGLNLPIVGLERVRLVGYRVDSVRILFGGSSESTVDLRDQFVVQAAAPAPVTYERVEAGNVQVGDRIARTRTAEFHEVEAIDRGLSTVRFHYADTGGTDRPRAIALWWREVRSSWNAQRDLINDGERDRRDERRAARATAELPEGFTTWAELREFVEDRDHADYGNPTCGELLAAYAAGEAR